jgi:ferredoxin
MGLRYLEKTISLELDREKCVNCGLCIDVCPHAVFAQDGKKVAIADKGACMECGACETNCPAGAIMAGRGVGCAAGLLAKKLGKKGDCC